MREHRREELVSQAVDAGHSREYGDRIYDVAIEENVDPAVAFEVVLAGIGVRDLDESPAEAWEETQVEVPVWIAPQPSPGDAELERKLRLTYRRLRALSQEHGSARAALTAFRREPDVGVVEY